MQTSTSIQQKGNGYFCGKLEFDGERCSKPAIYVAILVVQNLTNEQKSLVLDKLKKWHPETTLNGVSGDNFHIPCCLIHKDQIPTVVIMAVDNDKDKISIIEVRDIKHMNDPKDDVILNATL